MATRALIEAVAKVVQEERRRGISDEEVQQIVAAMVAKKLTELTPQGGVVYQL